MYGTYLRLDITVLTAGGPSFVRQPVSSQDERGAIPSIARPASGSTARCSITTARHGSSC